MGLSSDLISQFVKITKDENRSPTETTSYGVVKIASDGAKYVQLDGSEVLTPISSTVGVGDGDRVIVMVKNHIATVTGNLSDPSVRSSDTTTVDDITRLEILIADKADIEDLNVESGRIDLLESDNVKINGTLNAYKTDITNLQAKNATIEERLTVDEAVISKLKTDYIDADIANIVNATVDNLNVTNSTLYNLESTYANFVKVTADNFQSVNSSIENLDTTYANIDFSNIDNAAMEHLYATSGLIEAVTISNGTITGNLVGVTIKGDIIEGNTIIADKLVIQGEDGLYYKLNTDGVTAEADQTEYNSLNGSVITAKSITATQISVDDLVAFDATIGGFNITNTSIYSEVKDSEDNTTRGIYMDTDGQVNFGDNNNFIKYYRDENGDYKLVISAESILYALNGSQHSIADIGKLGEYVNVSVYDGEPCIELGELDSDFKLRITNTRMSFTEGSSVLAYFNNQSLHIKKAVVEEEFQQGGFIWKKRSNGNVGLAWKGGTN